MIRKFSSEVGEIKESIFMRTVPKLGKYPLFFSYSVSREISFYGCLHLPFESPLFLGRRCRVAGFSNPRWPVWFLLSAGWMSDCESDSV